jgi:predicted PurR-regulated permease PerM
MSKTSWDIRFRYLVAIFLVLFGIFVVWYFRELISPLLIAALTAYFLNPLSKFLILRWRVRPKVAANLVYFIVLILLFALPFTVLPLLFDEFGNIVQDLYRALDELQVILAKPIIIGNASVYLGSIIPAIRNILRTGYVPKPQDALYILEVVSRNFLWMLVILVAAYYLMTDWERLRNNLVSLAPKDQRSELNRLYRDIRLIWNSYLLGQVRLIFVLIIIYSITWSAIGLPGAIALGILAGVLNLLPEIGPGIIAIIAVVVAFLEGSTFLPISNLWFALLTLGVYLLLNNIKTIWLQPRILGHSVLLHEGLVFVAIVTAVILQGMLGVLIVVPLLATLAVVGRYLRAKILDLSPFEDEEPAFMQNLAPEPASKIESAPRKSPARKKSVK